MLSGLTSISQMEHRSEQIMFEHPKNRRWDDYANFRWLHRMHLLLQRDNLRNGDTKRGAFHKKKAEYYYGYLSAKASADVYEVLNKCRCHH